MVIVKVFFGGVRTPLATGMNTEGWVNSGNIKGGLNYNNSNKNKSLAISFFGQQGLAFFSKDVQLQDFALNGIYPGESKALGLTMNFNWTIKPQFGINTSTSTQLALNPLTSGMSFSVGGATGLKGLPSSVTSGDSGWLQTIEAVITTNQNEDNSLA